MRMRAVHLLHVYFWPEKNLLFYGHNLGQDLIINLQNYDILDVICQQVQLS